MGITERILNLFGINAPLDKKNASSILAKMTGDNNFKPAVRHLIRNDRRIRLSGLDRDNC